MAEKRQEHARLVVVMGAAGAGKTTLGIELAARLGVPYADGDCFHSSASIAKMMSGTPLSDDDRAPWLQAIASWLERQREHGAVASCSALRRCYRDLLRARLPTLTFLYLAAEPELLLARTTARTDHFMPTSLVASQLATLEPLEPDELGLTLDASRPVEELLAEFLAHG
jgi:gluconokinase